MWVARNNQRAIVCCSRSFKLAYRFAKEYKGTLTYKP